MKTLNKLLIVMAMGVLALLSAACQNSEEETPRTVHEEPIPTLAPTETSKPNTFSSSEAKNFAIEDIMSWPTKWPGHNASFDSAVCFAEYFHSSDTWSIDCDAGFFRNGEMRDVMVTYTLEDRPHGLLNRGDPDWDWLGRDNDICVDGWDTPSDGRPGRCSWHGGDDDGR